MKSLLHFFANGSKAFNNFTRIAICMVMVWIGGLKVIETEGKKTGKFGPANGAVMEKLIEEVSFEATRRSGQTITIDASFVDGRLASLAQSEDLARYIL